jgi:hypothetical protein
MLRNRENIRLIPFDAIIILSIVFFGLMIHIDRMKSIPAHKNIPVSVYISVNKDNAVSNPCIRLQVYQKTWILNKDNYNILAFNRNPFSESQRTGINITHFLVLRHSLVRVPQFILRYHLFPGETDAFPDLG